VPKVAIVPFFSGPDRADGGIRRVVEAQTKWLPEFGWDVVRNTKDADLVASHAGNPDDTDARKPMIAHCHGLYWSTYTWQRWALQMNHNVINSMRRADLVTAPSEWVAHAIRRGSQINPVVLYHGVDLEDWPVGSPDGKQYVLWNKTREDSVCDPMPALELAKRVPNVAVRTTILPLRHVGDIPPNLDVIGVSPLEEAKDYVHRADVYLATTRETFGVATLEAMSSGVPVLGWDWGGQSEIVTHKVDGYLAKVDDYDDLVRGLDFIHENRAAMSRAARAKVEAQFQWKTRIEAYTIWYNMLMRAFEQGEANPRISVVIPAYNMETMLEDAVKSVVVDNATADTEIIIVDDASTDGTGKLADHLADLYPGIKVVHNETNRYLAEALNVGIRAARGRYIVPLDADNMLGGGCLAVLVRSLEDDRSIDIAYGAMSVIEVDGPEAGKEWVSSWPPQFEYRRQMKHQNQITSTSMYRKRIWQRVGGYRRRCRTAEDADFWCRATSFGANAKKVTDAVVLRYRNRSDSMSHVQEDWAWHEWYPWGKDTSLTPWAAPIDDDCFIGPHERPIISVIIPVGPGHESLVLDALDSLNAQSFVWWEAIVINDTGTLLPWCPPWVHVISTGTDGPVGAGAARNIGMGFIKGSHFVFLDADDYFQPQALEKMFEASNRAGGGFVYTDWFRHDTGVAHQAPEWSGCSEVLQRLPWPVTCLYPREAAKLSFDEDLPAWEDWDFAIRVVEAGFCGTRVPIPLFHYRMGTGSRREAGVADAENLKTRILSRWQHYIKGDKQMPCGCSGGGGLPSLPAVDLSTGQPTFAMPEDINTQDMVQLEFVDETVQAPLVFSGRETGTRYRFGNDPDNKVRWVHRKDATHFVERGDFRVYADSMSNSPLLAAGPPR
jgi:glycosyltransferase involved in cell wall biosynthesis